MSLIASLAIPQETVIDADFVGSSFGPVESDVYDCTVDMAYMGKSKGGALNVNLTLKTANGSEVTETIYISSGNSKGNKFTYTKDGAEHNLPGFNMINNLCLLTVGQPLSALQDEEKVIKIYNYDTRQDVNTAVPVLTQLLGQSISAGILKKIVDKNVQDDKGNWVPGGETREQNEIDVFFRATDGMTAFEIANQMDPTHRDKWAQKNSGQTRNTAKGGGTAKAANSGAFGQASAAPKPQQSLFTS
jgi:hypothetical protein